MSSNKDYEFNEKIHSILLNPYLSKESFQINIDLIKKHNIRNAFKSYFDKVGKVKNHLNLQLDSGIATLFESLLNNNKINFNKRNRMLEVYKDWKVCYNGDTSLENFFV